MTTSTLKPFEVLRRVHGIGSYYGFLPLSELAHENRGSAARAPYPETLKLEGLDAEARDVAGFLKQVRDAGLSPSSLTPLFTWHSNIAYGRPSPKEIVIQLHALSSDRPIADAVLIRATHALLEDLTKENLMVRVNSMGDKETRNRFTRELTTFFRKYDATLPPDSVLAAKKDVFGTAKALTCDSDYCELLPSPVDSLSEASRKHFEGLLEYLEETGTSYELSPGLFSNAPSWTDTCFEIKGTGASAWGGRYLDIARHFWKGISSSVGVVIRLAPGVREEIPAEKRRAPVRFVFVHIGSEAKRESIRLAEEMRHAHIPLMQTIGIESLTEQMRLAERVNPRYLIIMGRKEAFEHTVILRERSTHSENIIPLADLMGRLKQVA